MLLKDLVDDSYRCLACHIPLSMAAHAVCDDEKHKLSVKEYAVFVSLSPLACIGYSKCLQSSSAYGSLLLLSDIVNHQRVIVKPNLTSRQYPARPFSGKLSIGILATGLMAFEEASFCVDG
jgi:hypothetical protein